VLLAKRQGAMVYGDMGKGFIHVFDEISLEIILKSQQFLILLII